MMEDAKKDHHSNKLRIPPKENGTGESGSSPLKTCLSNMWETYRT